MKRACSALSKSVGLGIFQNAYCPYFIHDSRVNLLYATISCSDGPSRYFQRELLSGVKDLVATCEEVSNAA